MVSSYSPVPLTRIHESRIMVVEDNPVNQMLVLEVLRHKGFKHLEGANDGQDAFNKLDNFLPDLIILDLMMPDLDGFGFCQLIRTQPRFHDIPILAYTALENTTKRLSILEMGANDVITKPVNPDELVARCRIHLERRYIMKDLRDYHERIGEELKSAGELQNLLMPSAAVIADVEFDFNVGISSLFAPTSAIGGDFWGIRSLDNSRYLSLFLGDFTGHGISSAINVFRLFTLLDRLPDEVLLAPQECLEQLNRQLYSMLPTEHFATMFYSILDKEKNELRYASAGAPPPLLLHGKGETPFTILDARGLPLAAANNIHYPEKSILFKPNDSLVLYSDALVETPNDQKQFLEIETIGTALSKFPTDKRSADHLLTSITTQLCEFTSHPVQDDLTIAVCTRLE